LVQESGVLARRRELSVVVDRDGRVGWLGTARRAGYLPRSNALPFAVSRWWVVASGCAVADAITTYLALRTRIGREANPLIAWLVDRIGLMPTLMLRATALGVGVMGVVALFAACDRRLLRTGARVILVGGTLFWAAVFVNNTFVLAR
jgi:hypothetical protein